MNGVYSMVGLDLLPFTLTWHDGDEDDYWRERNPSDMQLRNGMFSSDECQINYKNVKESIQTTLLPPETQSLQHVIKKPQK